MKTISRLVSLLVVSTVATGLCAEEKPKEQKKTDASYNHLFDIRNIEGWTVYINKEDLAEHPDEMAAALHHFRQQLYQIRLNVPRPAVGIMQEKVPLWFEYDTLGIAYHYRGWLISHDYKPPDVPTNAGFCRAKTFEKGALHQPWVVLHELAHGYDYRYLRKPRQPGHPLLKASYDKAEKDGKYDPVLCRYSKGTKAYGLNNPTEFFAENSEAFFGTNDFYPFVRAELREYDPQTYNALITLWGMDKEAMIADERSLAALLDAATPKKTSGRGAPGHAQTYKPTNAYLKKQIEGWTVYIDPDMKDTKVYTDEMCKLLGYKLHLVNRYVPEKGLAALHKIPIWLERNSSAVEYITCHNDKKALDQMGLNPDKLNAVEIGNADNFGRWQNLQQSAVLHYLGRAYYQQLDPAGHKAVAEQYAKACKEGRYDRVLRFDGRQVRHPGLLNERAFFAEMTESYYGFNDHYPFLQFELAEHDPEVCQLLAKLWGGKAK